MLTAAHRALSEQRGAGPSVALSEPEPLSTHRHLHLAFHSESPLDIDSSATCLNPHSVRETVTGGFVQEITRPASHSGHGPGSREVSLGCGADLFSYHQVPVDGSRGAGPVALQPGLWGKGARTSLSAVALP